jgi:hypothetical protein
LADSAKARDSFAMQTRSSSRLRSFPSRLSDLHIRLNKVTLQTPKEFLTVFSGSKIVKPSYRPLHPHQINQVVKYGVRGNEFRDQRLILRVDQPNDVNDALRVRVAYKFKVALGRFRCIA